MSWRWFSKKLQKNGAELTDTWGNVPGRGKKMKRRYHKSFRQWLRNHGGRERTVASRIHEVKWKGW